jgi:uncharacterized protein YkwD
LNAGSLCFLQERSMNRRSGRLECALALACLSLGVTAATHADALSAVQVLRAGGCGGVMPAARALKRSALLDRVAQEWASGSSLSAAAQRSVFRSVSTTGVRVSGPDSSLLETLRRSECHSVASQGLREVGFFRRGQDNWVVLSPGVEAPVHPQLQASAPVLASRALQLVNEARARGARCGTKVFGPAPAMSLSGTLAGVASGHAIDMAEHNYFEHVDLGGKSPADRVRAVGYKEKLVGENIAYGPESVEEVVQGWLDSPGHCENLMDPRFAQMGIAYSSGRTSRRGLYWVQLLAEPRA